jgi:hypothetical protein
VRILPANWRSWLVPPVVGAVAGFQLVDVLQLLSPGPVLPPFHRKVPARRWVATRRRARPAASRPAWIVGEAGRTPAPRLRRINAAQRSWLALGISWFASTNKIN